MTDNAGGREGRLLDFPALARRLRVTAAVLGMLAVAGAVVDGLLTGLDFAGMAVWASLFGVVVLGSGAVLVAIDAYRGAERAQRRGHRLSGADVGLMPPNRSKD